MPAPDWKNAPTDRAAADALAANGLEYRVIDTADASVFDPYLQAEMRGFLAGEQSDEQIGGAREGLAFRRFVGVYDSGSFNRAQPVGTVNSWVTDMTVPPWPHRPGLGDQRGDRRAGTHRRNGHRPRRCSRVSCGPRPPQGCRDRRT